MKPYPWTAFNVPVLVTWQRVRDLIITALEGGIGYWCRLEATEPANRSCSLFDVPTQPDAEGNIGGGALLLRELNDDGSEERLLRLDMTALQRGLTLLLQGKPIPRHAAAFIGDNADAETADVFIQLCVFGEVVYG